VNQLIHYWYCGISASHLLSLGFTSIEVRPTGHDNATDLGDDEKDGGPFDLAARHPSLGRLAGEVFCVSEALWPQKMAKTRAKLAKSKADVLAVFYNAEAKTSYAPKMSNLVVLGITAETGGVDLIASNSRTWSQAKFP
jgi:hypothetical protein